MKTFLKFAASIVGVLVLAAGATLLYQVRSFDSAAREVWDVDAPAIAAVTDSSALARGEHVANALGGCTGCHGPDLSGGLVEDLGPIGIISAPNLTSGAGGVTSAYTDAELARAIRHGIRPDGTSLRFMPTKEHNWWPDADLQAVVSFVRSRPPVDHAPEPTRIGTLGKLLDRFGMFQILSAETVDHDAPPATVVRAATAEYGSYLTIQCTSCHGDGLAGGKLPGAPAELPTPRNLTPHDTGLAGWSIEDFRRAVQEGTRPDGTELQDFMPRFTAWDDVELQAAWAYLTSLEPREFGER